MEYVARPNQQAIGAYAYIFNSSLTQNESIEWIFTVFNITNIEAPAGLDAGLPETKRVILLQKYCQ